MQITSESRIQKDDGMCQRRELYIEQAPSPMANPLNWSSITCLSADRSLGLLRPGLALLLSTALLTISVGTASVRTGRYEFLEAGWEHMSSPAAQRHGFTMRRLSIRMACDSDRLRMIQTSQRRDPQCRKSVHDDLGLGRVLLLRGKP